MNLEEGVYSVDPDEGENSSRSGKHRCAATHDFLSESDIACLKPLVLPALRGLENVLCVRGESGLIVGFVAVGDGKIEALFVHPAWHRMGAGRRVTFAMPSGTWGRATSK